MARARARIYAADRSGNAYSGAAVTLYEGETLELNGSGAVTEGTAYQSSLYAAVSGGSPTTSFTTDANGMVEVWTEKPRRFDYRVAPSGVTPYMYANEPWELDTAEVLRAGNTSIFTLEQFGFRNGVLTDQACFAAAIEAIEEEGRGILQLPAETDIDLTGVTPTSNLTIRGAGVGLTTLRGVTAVNDAKMLSAFGSYGSTSALASDASEGATSVTIQGGGVASLGIEIGDIVMLSQDVAYVSGGNPGVWPYHQLFMVRSTSGGNVVNLREPLADAYTQGQGAVLRKVTAPITNFGIEDCTLDGAQMSGTTAHGLWLVGMVNPTVRNVAFRNFENGSGLLIFQSYGFTVEGVETENAGNAGYSDIWLEYATNGLVIGTTSLRASGFGLGLNNVVHSRFIAPGASGPVNRSIKLAASSYNQFAAAQVMGGEETGFSITIASHHNVVMGLTALAHSGASAGLWMGDGLTDSGTMPSHHNAVYGYLGRFDATQDILLDANADENYVHAIVAGEITDAGVRNVIETSAPTTLTNLGSSLIKPLTFGKRVDAFGSTTSSATFTSASYADVADMSVSFTPSGGVVDVEYEGMYSHSGAGETVTVAIQRDSESEVQERTVSFAANQQLQVKTRARITGLTAGTAYTFKARHKTSASTATRVGTQRSITVWEGQIA